MAIDTSQYSYTPTSLGIEEEERFRAVYEIGNVPIEAYLIVFYDSVGYQLSHPSATAVYIPSTGRIAIDFGAGYDWADAPSAADGIKMWATDQDAWEAAN